MFSKTRTRTSTGASSGAVERLGEALRDADAVVIGAGAGLSTSAGFTYSGERFEQHFADFEAKYGFHDMYTGGFYPFETPEEYWAYWSRFIWINRYTDPPRDTYGVLRELVRGKDCFVLTTNVDHCFQRAGFDKRRLFYTQGDYGLLQCSEPCCRETWDNEDLIRRMVTEQKDMRVPTELIPRCPRCGRQLTTNLRADGRFVEDAGWHAAAGRYEDFLRRHGSGKVLYLELGVGFNTPVIIKYPFWQFTARNRDAVFACINYGEAFAPAQIARQSICIDADIDPVLRRLLAARRQPDR